MKFEEVKKLLDCSPVWKAGGDGYYELADRTAIIELDEEREELHYFLISLGKGSIKTHIKTELLHEAIEHYKKLGYVHALIGFDEENRNYINIEISSGSKEENIAK